MGRNVYTYSYSAWRSGFQRQMVEVILCLIHGLFSSLIQARLLSYFIYLLTSFLKKFPLPLPLTGNSSNAFYTYPQICRYLCKMQNCLFCVYAVFNLHKWRWATNHIFFLFQLSTVFSSSIPVAMSTSILCPVTAAWCFIIHSPCCTELLPL